MRSLLVAIVALATGAADASETGRPAPTSAYTPLSGSSCHVHKTAESDESVQDCPGVDGYRLEVVDSDSRMTVTILTPDGKAFPLRFWDVVTRHFSSLGERAEWRLRRDDGRERPVALIVRVRASEDPESNRQVEYLAVARVEADSACVIARIAAAADANRRARDAADAAVSAKCLTDLP